MTIRILLFCAECFSFFSKIELLDDVESSNYFKKNEKHLAQNIKMQMVISIYDT